jgi:hypothetical protein
MALSLNVLDQSEDIELLYEYPVNLFMIDKNTGKELFVKTDFTTPGYYFFNLEQGFDYVITVKDFNKKEKRLPFSTKNITRSDTLELDAIIVNTFPEQSFVVKNIYYEFAKAELTDTARKTLDNTIYKFMSAYPELIIEISSHTDAVIPKTSILNFLKTDTIGCKLSDYESINSRKIVPKDMVKHSLLPKHSS